MSISSFSKPSDSDVLQKVIEKDSIISFVDKGSILQNVSETLYVRTVKIKIDKKEVLKRVVYIKKGITWLFKAIETVTPVTNLTPQKEKSVH
ncbi:MAG TPA: hypothetical protein ENK46_07300 [Flavobacteriia bacterium]|jgi:hypothetical protein|nr:hypothetical protein [Flavobacteriia bacterium]